MDWFTNLYVFLKGLHPFLTGATFILNVVAAFLFVRFYRKSRERLFLFFAAAFAIMSLNRLAFGIFNAVEKDSTVLYVMRLAAFLLIFFAILDKNRTPRAPRP